MHVGGLWLSLLLFTPATASAQPKSGEQEERLVALTDQAIDVVFDPVATATERLSAAERLTGMPDRSALRLVERWEDLDPTPRRDSQVWVSHILTRMGPRSGPAIAKLVSETSDLGTDGESLIRTRLLADVLPWRTELRPELERLRRSMKVKREDYVGLCEQTRLDARMAVDPRAPTSELVRQIEPDNPFEAEFLAEILAARGPAAEEAIEPLLQVIDANRNAYTGIGFAVKEEKRAGYVTTRQPLRAIVEALGSIAAPNDPRLAPVYEMRIRFGGVEHPGRLTGIEAARRMGMLGASARIEVLTQLVENASDGLPITHAAMRSLGRLGKHASSALPALDALAGERFVDRSLPPAAKAAAAAIRAARER